VGIGMNIIRLEISGVYLIENYEFYDDRGGFVKTFSNYIFKDKGINFSPKEVYYTISHKDVIRGMHFQVPPYEHAKLIYLTSGNIMDVILDLRKNSETYGKAISVELKVNKNSLYIPIGCAHGFRSLEENSVIVYSLTECYSKEHDEGILWNSFGLDWGIEHPIISERDKSFVKLQEYDSPF